MVPTPGGDGGITVELHHNVRESLYYSIIIVLGGWGKLVVSEISKF